MPAQGVSEVTRTLPETKLQAINMTLSPRRYWVCCMKDTELNLLWNHEQWFQRTTRPGMVSQS